MTVVESDGITQDDLFRLFDKSITAVRVPAYYTREASAALADALLQSKLHGKYENAPNIGRVGQAFFESQASEEAARRYERQAVTWIKELRANFFPNLTPIDRVRLEMDEAWLQGAQVARMNGHKMFVGLARTFMKGSFAEPHQDVFAWDAPDSEEAQRVQTQLTMNVYLAMPAAGGDLTLWSVSFDRVEYNRRKNPGSYGLKRDTLPAPAATLRPQVGELILFNATNLHAVEEITCGARVTWSCFVGYQGEESPLLLWS